MSESAVFVGHWSFYKSLRSWLVAGESSKVRNVCVNKNTIKHRENASLNLLWRSNIFGCIKARSSNRHHFSQEIRQCSLLLCVFFRQRKINFNWYTVFLHSHEQNLMNNAHSKKYYNRHWTRVYSLESGVDLLCNCYFKGHKIFFIVFRSNADYNVVQIHFFLLNIHYSTNYLSNNNKKNYFCFSCCVLFKLLLKILWRFEGLSVR